MRRASPRHALRGVLLVALAGAALVAVPASSLARPAAAKVYVIEIRRMAFAPPPATLKVGDTIEWVNADIFRHTATARDRSFDVDLVPKAHVRTVLKAPGAVAFYCRFHPGMTGVLKVAK